jgi:uncharacterized membrane protein affecting hemolysin expression
MDLTERKYRFIERFKQLSNTDKLQQLENILFEDKSESDDSVYDLQGQKISKEEYIKRNNEAVNSYKQGDFKTSEQLKEKFLLK